MLDCTPLRVAMALACAASLAACSDRSDAEDAVRKRLKDPDSAKFGDFYFNEKTEEGCLTVNSKNSMGGYTGNQQAFVSRKDGVWRGGYIADTDPETCRRVVDKAR